MGIYDRDYYRRPTRGGFADFRMWSVNTWIIILNIAVFVADAILYRLVQSNDFDSDGPFQLRDPFGPLYHLGSFSYTMAIQHLQLWRFLTFQFIHVNIWHIACNMIALYFFGPIVESQLGARRYLGFYLFCGFAGTVMYLILWFAGILVNRPDVEMVGASAGIFGVLVGAAKIAPDMQITLLFPPIPLRLRTFAWIFVAIAAYTVFTQGTNAGGEASHLGGAILGFVLIRNQHWLNFLVPRSTAFAPTRKKVAFRDWSRDSNH